MRFLVVVSLVFDAVSALAQDKPEQRRTVIDMDADVIEGSLHQPDHAVVRAPTRNKFKSLIELRKEFRREVLASAARL
jgi:hypothetical protein